MSSSTERTKLAEGKTKVIWDAGDGEVAIESKDDITAGDGASRDLLEGKAVTATKTTRNVFLLLEKQGIRTHFVGDEEEESANPRVFRAERVDMIPLELVVRRIATGSYLKRNPDVTEGTIFPELIMEFFEKDDANHDPLLVVDLASRRLLRYKADKPLAEGFINEEPFEGSCLDQHGSDEVLELISTAERVFLVLEDAWAEQDVALVDLKIECGWSPGTGEIIVADVIDNDSWRIWPEGEKEQMKDKQVYRELADVEDPAAKAKELGKIKQNYAWVADATAKFIAV